MEALRKQKAALEKKLEKMHRDAFAYAVQLDFFKYDGRYSKDTMWAMGEAVKTGLIKKPLTKAEMHPGSATEEEVRTKHDRLEERIKNYEWRMRAVDYAIEKEEAESKKKEEEAKKEPAVSTKKFVFKKKEVVEEKKEEPAPAPKKFVIKSKLERNRPPPIEIPPPRPIATGLNLTGRAPGPPPQMVSLPRGMVPRPPPGPPPEHFKLLYAKHTL